MGCPNTRLATRLLSREAVAQPYNILNIFCSIFAPTYMHVSWLYPLFLLSGNCTVFYQRSFVQNSITISANPITHYHFVKPKWPSMHIQDDSLGTFIVSKIMWFHTWLCPHVYSNIYVHVDSRLHRWTCCAPGEQHVWRIPVVVLTQ